MKISNLADLKYFFNSIPNSIISIGVYAFDNIGLESLLDNFSIVALNYSIDTQVIEKKVNVLSLEKDHPESIREVKRNSLSMLRTETVQNYLKQLPDPLIISYKGREKFEEICETNGYISAVGKSSLYKFLDDKSNFRDLLVRNNMQNYPPFRSYSLDNLRRQTYNELSSMLGNKLVIQGKTLVTKFISSEMEFNQILTELDQNILEIKETDRFLVSKFIKGKPASITCVATKWGTFTSNVQYQLIDIPELTEDNGRSGFFCGHDWTASKKISKEINAKASNFGRVFGETIYKLGYKGFFGLDLMIDDETNEIYVNECNARMTGVLPTVDLIQYKNNEIPFLGLHCLEFLPDNLTNKLDLEFDEIDASLKTPKDGSHFFITSGVKGPNNLEINLRPGVYAIEAGELIYKREGYRLEDLKNSEFIFSETPSANLRIDRLSRIGRVVSNSQVLDEDFKFNSYGKSIVDSYRNHLRYLSID